jgi:hypothetical protein
LRRFGPAGDGGYLMPDDIDGIAACISPGVSDECGFDLEFAERGIPVYMADASVTQPPVPHPNFRFFPFHLDVASTAHTMTLEQLCAEAPPGDLLLQMDIESAEYRVLAAASDALLRRFRIIVVEFHELDHLFSRFSFVAMKAAFDKLLATHAVVHLHPNNCIQAVRRKDLIVPPLMEFTFYRKDRMPNGAAVPLKFPHELDAHCVPTRPPIPLPQCWRPAT